MFQDNIWECVQQNGMPTPKSGHCCCVVANNFYVFGGQSNTEILNEFHRFNLEDKTWSKLKSDSQPNGRSSAGMCGVDDIKKIYLFGGTLLIVEKTSKNDLYEYDIQKNNWNIVMSQTQGPCDRYGHSMIISNYQIFIFGGVHYVKVQNRMNPEFLNDLWVFSLIDKIWKKLDLRAQIQPQARYRHTTAIIGNELYIIGGTTNQNRYGQIVKTDFSNMTWQFLELEALKNKSKKNLFKGRYGHACFVIENMVYIYSGQDDGLCDDALQLDVIQNKWKSKKFRGNIPSREFFSFAQTSNQLFIFGGRSQQNQRLNDLYVWNHNLRQEEQQYCTLRQDIYSLLEMNQNCSDLTIYTKSSTQFALHKSFISIRCPILLQNQNLQFSDILVQILIKYIYKGEITLDLLSKVEIRETLQFCVFLQDDIFASAIIQYFLIDCRGQSDYDFIEKELQQLQNKGNVSAQINFLLKSVLQMLEQRKQKQFINLFQQQRIIFNNIQNQIVVKFYSDMRKLQYHSETDTVIIAQEKQINVHSFLLVARSEYFREMINFQNGVIQQVQVDFDPQILQNIINYLYCGYQALQRQNEGNFDHLINAYKASSYFMLNNQTFLYLIQEGMAEFISKENVFDLAEIAEQINATFLLYECCTFISENLKGVSLTELRKLSKEVLIRVIEVIGQKQ
ncbi:unnamed protein product [Paramecium sonneborni]|uniref:BTB domain-containing protein n=1 Tax=Paramecium sonneborni TaxID=65129 RepID=A0A8S1LKE7_9CILI|nr:unnamed protein product [Paramecium sonneborni]